MMSEAERMAFLKAQGKVLVLKEQRGKLTDAIKIHKNALTSIEAALLVVDQALSDAEAKLKEYGVECIKKG